MLYDMLFKALLYLHVQQRFLFSFLCIDEDLVAANRFYYLKKWSAFYTFVTISTLANSQLLGGIRKTILFFFSLFTPVFVQICTFIF